MTTENDNRNTYRYSRNETISLELTVAGSEDSAPRVVRTQTLDCSEEGLKVRMAEEIPVVKGISLVIEPLDRDERYQLRGEVRWCRRVLDSLYEAGIHIEDDGSDEYRRWRSYVDEDDQAPQAE